MDNENKKVQHLTEEQIAVYAEALATDNSANLPDEAKKHVKECLECSSEIQIVSEILREDYKNSIAEGLNSVKKSKNININVWIAVAASIITIAALGYLFTKNNGVPENNLMAIDSTIFNTNNIVSNNKIKQDTVTINSKINNDSEIKKESIGNSTKKKEILIAFVPNKELEKLSERYKDNAMRGEEEIVISSEQKSFNTSDSISISLNKSNNQYLTVEVFDNKGAKITQLTTKENSVKLNDINEEGLYYWKLINEDYDLLYCGKIIIKD